jgi:PAS domain S-box-containing protein
MLSKIIKNLFKTNDCVCPSQGSKTEEFFEAIVENIPNMVFIKDASSLNFVLFNRAGEELLGYSRADLIGKNDYNFFPKEQADFFTSRDKLVLRQGGVHDIPEEEVQTKTGIKILHTKKIPIFNKKGEAIYLLGISEDITEKKRLEVRLNELESMLEHKKKNTLA